MLPFRIRPQDLPLVKNVDFHRPRDPQIYIGPRVIATRGIGKRGFYAAVCPSDVVYDSLYYGFSLPEDDAHFLNGVLNSRLATYWLFMTASTWGVERDELQPSDLLRLPVPRPSKAVAGLVDAVAAATRECERTRGDDLASARRRLDMAVYRLYDVTDDEAIFVEDFLAITLDQRVHRSRSLAVKRPTIPQLIEYASRLAGAIQPLLTARGRRTAQADVLDTGPSPLSVVRLRVVSDPGDRPVVITDTAGDLGTVLRGIDRRLKKPITDQVCSGRVLRVYAGNDLFIIKPSQYRYWSQSAALNDSNDILAEHLGASRDSH
jgi:hypothetical protein